MSSWTSRIWDTCMSVNELQERLGQLEALACTVYGEARGEAVEGQIAVACVIRNRRRASNFVKSYKDIVFAPAQFSCWQSKGGAANYNDTLAAAKEMVCTTGVNVKTGTPDRAVLYQCLWVASGVLTGNLLDNTHGALNYYAASMKTPPSWAKDMTVTARIGGHIFLKP